MNGLQVGFLKVTESVEYFLPLVRPQGGQDIQDFSFAHNQSLRVGPAKDKRKLSSPLPWSQSPALPCGIKGVPWTARCQA